MKKNRIKGKTKSVTFEFPLPAISYEDLKRELFVLDDSRQEHVFKITWDSSSRRILSCSHPPCQGPKSMVGGGKVHHQHKVAIPYTISITNRESRKTVARFKGELTKMSVF